MTITFLCPNGHQLTTGDDRAGKPGQCPKCGTKFVVPEAEEAIEATDISDESSAEEPVAAGPQKDDIIVFLCPNGHRLNGPARLQGKPGQCPHCGSKFRIPSYDEETGESKIVETPAPPVEAPADQPPVEAAEIADFGAIAQPPPAPEIPVGTIVEDQGEVPEDAVEIIDEIEEIQSRIGAEQPAAVVEPEPSTAQRIHPLADIFLQLWNRRGRGTVVELHLREGATITPESIAKTMSYEDYGVFAVKDEDGTYTVTTIPWESVSRIGISKMKKLPDGLFE